MTTEDWQCRYQICFWSLQLYYQMVSKWPCIALCWRKFCQCHHQINDPVASTHDTRYISPLVFHWIQYHHPKNLSVFCSYWLFISPTIGFVLILLNFATSLILSLFYWTFFYESRIFFRPFLLSTSNSISVFCHNIWLQDPLSLSQSHLCPNCGCHLIWLQIPV